MSVLGLIVFEGCRWLDSPLSLFDSVAISRCFQGRTERQGEEEENPFAQHGASPRIGASPFPRRLVQMHTEPVFFCLSGFTNWLQLVIDKRVDNLQFVFAKARHGEFALNKQFLALVLLSPICHAKLKITIPLIVFLL